VHRTRWSGAHPDNSLAGLRECYAERVARAEIDFRLADGELVVAHDAPRGGARLLLTDALEVVRTAPPGPTVLMLDAKDEAPSPPALVERIARLIEPVRERVFVGSPADWNLRRLRAVDPSVAVTFDPQYYLDRKGSRSPLPGAAGAYGYHDAHPLAFRRTLPVAEYLRERLEGLCRLVPGIRELHLHLALFEEMVDDGLDVCSVVHDAGAAVDVWTLDAGTPRWRERLAGALRAGVDIVTTNTPRELSAAAREGSAMPAS
jgi:glycerophosphoryl diester phosphodiesterase